MDTNELKKLSREEMLKLLEENRQKLRELRFDLSFGKVKNVRSIQALKKEIARIMTILNQ